MTAILSWGRWVNEYLQICLHWSDNIIQKFMWHRAWSHRRASDNEVTQIRESQQPLACVKSCFYQCSPQFGNAFSLLPFHSCRYASITQTIIVLNDEYCLFTAKSSFEPILTYFNWTVRISIQHISVFKHENELGNVAIKMSLFQFVDWSIGIVDKINYQ